MGCHALLQGIFPTHGSNTVSCGSFIAGGLFTAEPPEGPAEVAGHPEDSASLPSKHAGVRMASQVPSVPGLPCGSPELLGAQQQCPQWATASSWQQLSLGLSVPGGWLAQSHSDGNCGCSFRRHHVLGRESPQRAMLRMPLWVTSGATLVFIV